jgi:hypothetical protein
MHIDAQGCKPPTRALAPALAAPTHCREHRVGCLPRVSRQLARGRDGGGSGL